MFEIVYGFVLLCLLAAVICASVGVFRMGEILFPGSRRYLYAIGVLISPLLGLIIMHIANSNANGYLRVRGYEIGVFGAKR